MSAIEKVREEIATLEREIRELESEKRDSSDSEVLFDDEEVEESNDFLPEIDFTQIGTVDSIIYDIINEHKSQTDDKLECDVVDGQRVFRTRELKQVHDEEMSKIQAENVFRFNGITVFPISNDPNGDFLGLRFDIFNIFHKQFVSPHYIILKQLEATNDNSKTNTISTEKQPMWKWSVFQTTVPKFISVAELALTYLVTTTHERETSDWFDNGTPFIPGFNRINKFAMRVYNELVQLETRRACVLNFAHKHAGNSKITVDWDTSVSTVRVQIFGVDGAITTMKLKTTHTGTFTIHSKNNNLVHPDIPIKDFNMALRSIETDIEMISKVSRR